MPKLLLVPQDTGNRTSLDHMIESNANLDKLIVEFKILQKMLDDLRKDVFADLGWAGK